MQKWIVFLFCCAMLLIGAVALPARAERVRTSDGHIYNGYVRLDGTQLLVDTTDGQSIRLDLSKVESANISQGPNPATHPSPPVAPPGTVVPATVSPTPKEIIHGLKGEYFDSLDFSSHQFTRLDPQLNITWQDGMPSPYMVSQFTVRWTGQLTSPLTGDYTISFHHDDGARIWIDKKLVLDSWQQGSTTQTFAVTLTANKPVDIRVEYYNNYSTGDVQLQWSLGKNPLQDIPSTALTPPADFNRKDPDPIVITPGHGIYAEYFDDLNLQGLLLRRIEPTIDLTKRGIGPAPHVGRNFGARWTGFITPPKTDNYTFTTLTRDGVRLWINGNLIIDHYTLLEQEETAAIHLEGGKPVAIKMEFFAQRDTPVARLYWTSAAIPKEIVPMSALTPSSAEMHRADERDNGLLGQYFTDNTFKTECMTRHDSKIDFTWNSGNQGLPGAGVPQQFGVRWTAKLVAPVTGPFIFYMLADDNERVFLDGKPIIDGWNVACVETPSKPINLKAGQSYDLKVEMSNQGGGPAVAALSWSGPNIAKQIIPGENFHPPANHAKADPEITLDFPIQDQYLPGQPISLTASPWVDQGDAIKRVDFLLDGAVAGSVTKAPWTFQLTTAAPGHHMITARVVDRGDVSTDTGMFPILISTDASTVAPGWTSVRIGDNPSADDSLSVKDDVITMGAAPGDIMFNTDSFHYVAREMVGNGRLIVHLTSLDADKNKATPSAGLMIRESLDCVQRDAAVLISGANGDSTAASMHRDTLGAEPVYSGSAIKTPCWLKIERVGQHIATYVSPDAQHWIPTGSSDVQLPDTLYVGLFVAAKGTAPATATFDHLKFSYGKDPVANTSTAIQTIDGSILPGDVRSATVDAVQFVFNGKEMTIKTADIARLLLSPVPTQVLENLPTGHTGAIFPNGDFAQGDLVNASNDHISIMSLIFGAQNFSVPNDAVGFVLHDCNPPHHGYAITTNDNAVYCMANIPLSNSKIKFTDPIAGEVTLENKDIHKITRTK